MSDGERRALRTVVFPDLVSQPRIEGLNKKFEYELDMSNELDELIEIETALSHDNKEEFLRLLFKSPRLQTSDNISTIAEYIIAEGATKCAAAVLDGETNGIINPDVEYAMTEGHWTVIHSCATSFQSEVLALFLQRGFSANIRCDRKMLNYKQQLPLNVALRQLRYSLMKGFWGSLERSVGSLLMTLLEKADLLEVVTLLALNTAELKQEFFNYAKKGKWVEVGALLLAAGEKLMPLCISEGEDDVIVFNSFKEISHFLQAKYPWSAMNFDETKEMRETLLLLDIYDKIGNQLTTYARPKEDQKVDLNMRLLLVSEGFNVFNEDISYEDYLSRPNTSVYQFKAVGPREIEKFFSKQSQQPSIPTRHSFHTSAFRNIDSKFASLTPAAKKSVNVMQNLNSCKRWVSFMKIFRRGARCV